MQELTFQAAFGTTTAACTSSSEKRSSVGCIDVSDEPPLAPPAQNADRLLSPTFHFLDICACAPVDRSSAKAWIAAIHHFLFLSDPRTLRSIGEPKQVNTAVIHLSAEVGMNVETVSILFSPPFLFPDGSLTCLGQWFDFPYKRSVMTWLPRERWFKLDVLAFAEDHDTPPSNPATKL